MKIQCEKCHAEYEVSPSMFGKSVECQCGNTFVIPAPSVSKPRKERLQSSPQVQPSSPSDKNTSADAFSVCSPLYKNIQWIRFAMVAACVFGVAFILFPFGGILIGWIPIWAGREIRSASRFIEKSYQNKNDIESLKLGIEKLSKGLKLIGIFSLGAIGIFLLSIVIIGLSEYSKY